MKYVIIGNSAAGLSAAKEIRYKDKEGEIILIGKEEFLPYGRPMISYYLKNAIGLDKLSIHNENFYKDMNIDIVHDEVIRIDPIKTSVTLTNSVIKYDKLIIATGSLPFIPNIDNLDNKNNVYTFLDLKSAINLKEAVKPESSVVILGGGLIALKALEGLRGTTDNISVVELSDRILPTILNHKASAIVLEHIKKRGIKFYLNNTVTKVIGKDSVEKVILKDGMELKADIFVVAVGVRPEIKLAKDAGINTNKGIAVDSYMKTDIDNIYAAGDVVEVKDVLDGRMKNIALWPNAVITGRIAGANAVGGSESLDGTFPYNAIDFFGLRMITGGIIEPDQSYETIVIEDSRGYSAFIVKDDLLYGYILLGNVERAGIFTDIIRNRYKLSDMKDVFNTRSILSYPHKLRQDKLRGV